MIPLDSQEQECYARGWDDAIKRVLQELAKWKDEHGVARNIEHYIKKIKPEALL